MKSLIKISILLIANIVAIMLLCREGGTVGEQVVGLILIIAVTAGNVLAAWEIDEYMKNKQ